MDYMLMDNAGNALDHFETWDDVVAVLGRLVEQRPEAARELAIVRFDENGRPVGEPYTAADVVPNAARQMTLNVSLSFAWSQRGQATYVPLAPHASRPSSRDDALHLTAS